MLKTKKGFSMAEMLVCMLIISVFTLLSINRNTDIDLEHYTFLNKYLLEQSKAMRNRENIKVETGIYFNNMGHINQARTVGFNSHSVIIHLGNGYVSIK